MSRWTPSVALFALIVPGAPALAAVASGASGPVPGAVVGSANPVVATPPVSVPDEAPCVVTLYSGATFGANAVDFSYSPAACPGPWAKVVFSTDLSLNAGRQYDRTQTVWLGGVNILFGTTAEPSSGFGPAWHVERDVTDYTALFKTAQQGRVLIANYQNATYTSTITATGRLLFYPATARYPAPKTADMVIPLGSDAIGATVALNSGSDRYAKTLTLPRNIEGARLDLYQQSQNADEFWYTCVPDAQATNMQECGGGSFREGAVRIDDMAAASAPIYPWIYTGGIDPYLWRVLPGVQTLAFEPTKIDLTAFAGLLDDGRPHTLSLQTIGANNYFSVTGALLLTLDHGASVLGGSVLADTLTFPQANVSTAENGSGDNYSGRIVTTAAHDWRISGVLRTSHGIVATTTASHIGFTNTAVTNVVAGFVNQSSDQTTDWQQTTWTVGPDGLTTTQRLEHDPLHLTLSYGTVSADGTQTQATTLTQGRQTQSFGWHNLRLVEAAATSENVAPSSTLTFPPSGPYTHSGDHSTATYAQVALGTSLLPNCLRRDFASAAGVLTVAAQTTNCLALLQAAPNVAAALGAVTTGHAQAPAP